MSYESDNAVSASFTTFMILSTITSFFFFTRKKKRYGSKSSRFLKNDLWD
jgi:hypothetical protein